MQRRNAAIPIVFASTLFLAASLAFAQTFPGKVIRIVTSEAGGSNDIVSRLIAQGISGPLGQPVIVENRAGGSIAGETVLKAAPDGHTLLYYGNALWILPLMRKDVPYDVPRDFAPITLTATSPNVLVVHPSLPVKSVKELVALAKARPGEINYASAASGSATHLAGELFKYLAGVNIVRIAYKGNGPAINDLLGGHVQVMFAPAGAMAPLVKTGRLRALAVTNAHPSEAYPALPTISAAGVSGYEAETIYGMWAPAKAPGAVVSRLNQEVVRVLTQPDIKAKLFNIGLEVVANSPEQFAATIKSDIARMEKLVRETGIRAE